MNDNEALEYIQKYFYELFGKKDLSVLERYLDPNYWDDDIGNNSVNHINDSKDYLQNWFEKNPTINVYVSKAQIANNVICAFLEWNQQTDGKVKTIMKGIGIFEIEGMKIVKRHSYIYYKMT